MFVSAFDHKFNISDIDNTIDFDKFMCVYDHNSQYNDEILIKTDLFNPDTT